MRARYVILRHDPPPDGGKATHWDLMLQWGDCLRTWALADAPEKGKRVAARQLPDHRIAYLDYEGPISGNRGRVIRREGGLYELLEEHPGCLRVKLFRTDGLTVQLTLNRQESDRTQWIAHFA